MRTYGSKKRSTYLGRLSDGITLGDFSREDLPATAETAQTLPEDLEAYEKSYFETGDAEFLNFDRNIDDQFQNMAASRPAQNMSGFTSAQYVGQTLQNA